MRELCSVAVIEMGIVSSRVQLVVEKMLTAQGIKRTELGREAFVERVWEWKEKYGGTITNQMRRLGASCDWSREHFTLDDQLSGANLLVRLCVLILCALNLPIVYPNQFTGS